MSTSTTGQPGYLRSIRTLAESFLSSVQHRLELLAVELQEQKFQLIQTLIWVSAAIFTGMLAITFASLTLVYLFWESARLEVLAGLALFYTGVTIAIGVACRRQLARRPDPFAATMEELEIDRACIRAES